MKRTGNVSVIEMFHVYKIYPNNQVALIDVSLRLDKGDFAYIIGPSGAGKTTILKLILCLERPTKGLVLISGINTATIRKSSVPYLRRNIGVIFQDLKLLTNRTVFENVALALEIIGALQREVQKKVWEVLRLVGLHNKSNLYPSSLSAGEQQLVAIARAMVNDPLILLADEPTGNLDPEITASLMNLMDNINTRGTTVVVATHNPHLIRERNGKVFLLENGRITGD